MLVFMDLTYTVIERWHRRDVVAFGTRHVRAVYANKHGSLLDDA